VEHHNVNGKKFQTTASQKFLAVTKAKSLKTCLHQTNSRHWCHIVVSEEKNCYETAQGFYFVSKYPEVQKPKLNW